MPLVCTETGLGEALTPALVHSPRDRAKTHPEPFLCVKEMALDSIHGACLLRMVRCDTPTMHNLFILNKSYLELQALYQVINCERVKDHTSPSPWPDQRTHAYIPHHLHPWNFHDSHKPVMQKS